MALYYINLQVNSVSQQFLILVCPFVISLISSKSARFLSQGFIEKYYIATQGTIFYSRWYTASGIQQSSSFTFISCLQGPKPNTVNDFWRMVFEQKCPTIVMLTVLKEMQKVWYIICLRQFVNERVRITLRVRRSGYYQLFVVRRRRVKW